VPASRFSREGPRFAREAGMRRTLLGLLAIGLLILAGCGKRVVEPNHRGHAPDTQLTLGPVEGDTVSFWVHLYWSAFDADGEVLAYRWAVDPDSEKAGSPATWRRTNATDTTLIFPVDPVSASKRHVFLVAAEDNDGLVDPTPASRSFSSTTLPPTSRIESGPADAAPASPDFTFRFSGVDPDGKLLEQIIGATPVDSFQYLLLRVGMVNDYSIPRPPWHQPLPDPFGPVYYDLIGQATGDSLLYPHGDWPWIGVRGTQKRFTDMSPGEYVFAVRAVDVAGAKEQGITANLTAIRAHVRHFTVVHVPPPPPGPTLTVLSSVCFGSLAEVSPIVDYVAPRLRMFAGEIISFSWTGDASSYGGEIVGYDYALDDSSGLGDRYDSGLTAVTLGPDRLTPGSHALYVRCADDGGRVVTVILPLTMVHPSFKDPGAPREILYVDDFLSPGNTPSASGSFPSDPTETSWYLLSDPGRPFGESRFPRITAAFPGVTVTEWDTYQHGMSEDFHRKAPDAQDLAGVSTVVWVGDPNNTPSTQTALYKTIVGGGYSALAGYLRAGGTLIVSGFNTVDNVADFRFPLKDRADGLCNLYAPGSFEWSVDYFPRLYMGVDYTTSNQTGRRALGARDFVAAYPTADGAALGFDTAYVDTGIAATGAKWDTKSNLTGTLSFLDQALAPGIFVVEGWHMAPVFGCADGGPFAQEDPAAPIARPIYTYHGVPRGVLLDGGPSPREGLVCGLLCQSHDLGAASGGAGVYHPGSAVGRIVFLGFPLYFVKDQQASDALFRAFSYVNASPTLP
jgi:hypothetical protein